MIRLKDIKIRENLKLEEVFEKALIKYKIKKEEVVKWYIYKKSIDARKKDDIFFNYTIDIELKDKKRETKFEKVEEYKFPIINSKRNSKYIPVIIGAGPAGLFAGLTLIQNGIKPIILERGKNVEERIKDVDEFIKNKKFNISSNIQFGEGGAGTFSDGKLNTGNSSMFSRKVLEEFVNFGAPKEILYTAKPHIGTDNLVKIVKNIREYIIKNGGQVLFNEQVTDFEIEHGNIKAIICSKRIETDTVILAIGHSARDTFKRLYELGVEIKPKNFAVGVRIEHLQKDVNYFQYGDKTKLDLPPADYKLVYHSIENGRTCYTFCMCPGGYVMASSSDENTIVTNGMSNFSREGKNANSALLVNVNIDDYYKKSPLDGMNFQEELEKKAYKLGGSNYNAPVQKVEDFLANKKTKEFGKVKPTYRPGVTMANLNEILPEFVSETLKIGIVELDKKMHGFGDMEALLTGVETRSSSPVQITRDNVSLNSISVNGLYPCGEGAGYAGGIMTAAIDGIRCALKVIEPLRDSL